MLHPFSFGLFVGMFTGTTLIDDWVAQKDGYLAGARLGWDCDDYWGLEARYGTGSILLWDSPRATGDPKVYQLTHNDRNSELTLWDLTFLYYPWGEGRWRPYVMTGAGMAVLRFNDAHGADYSKTIMNMPLAAGLKYHCTERLALRLELCDDIIFSGVDGINTVHDFSITGSMELHFGGARRMYWPWEPSGRVW